LNILQLDDFIGNASLLKILKESALAGRLPHAVIFAGQEGVGKFSIAVSLSALLMCAERSDHSFCGKCRHCRLIEAGTHPDLQIIQLGENRKEIGIDSIRDLIHTIHKKPFLATLKSVIIDQADLMTEEASNALLKILEEPPGNANLFLVTSKPASLLPTIRSRSQIFRFSAISSPELESLLIRRGYSSGEARLATAMSNGSVANVMQWDEKKLKETNEIFNLIQKIITEGDYLAITALSGKIGSGRNEFDSIIGYCYSIFRDFLSIKTGCEDNLLINGNHEAALRKISGFIEVNGLYRILDDCDKLLLAGRRNLNLKMNSEDFVIKIASMRVSK
jgi:DNA polymerase-3 subunit delta'